MERTTVAFEEREPTELEASVPAKESWLAEQVRLMDAEEGFLG